MGYQEEYQRAADHPATFWLEQSGLIDWVSKPAVGFAADEHGVERWFPDGELNTCFNAVDRHVASGRGEQVAFFYDSPVTDSRETITYGQLQQRVARFAGALAGLGVGMGVGVG